MTDKPTSPGWWRGKYRDMDEPEIIQVDMHQGQLCAFITGNELEFAIDDIEWYEPVPTMDEMEKMRARILLLETLVKEKS
jgi:hypothetical protein